LIEKRLNFGSDSAIHGLIGSVFCRGEGVLELSRFLPT
jgi:hypothetical protein